MISQRLILLAACMAVGLMLACVKSQPPTAGEIEGQWLYENNCAECHENPQPDLHKQPPNLSGLFSRKSLPSGAPATDAEVRMTIVKGRNTMPAFDHRLRDQDIDKLLKYLHKLP